MSGIHALTELVTAVTVAVVFIRCWRQILALMVAVMVTLSVIGLMTVIHWVDALPRR